MITVQIQETISNHQKLLEKEPISRLMLKAQLVSLKSLKTKDFLCSTSSGYLARASSTFLRFWPSNFSLLRVSTQANTVNYLKSGYKNFAPSF